ncbi:neurotrophin 1-like [Ornithodoros turicata]|uniref:neurotrophin 1-like n=1 Tax=Ornithodoros turicata TaxID=34597 RepID=UPI0031398ADA
MSPAPGTCGGCTNHESIHARPCKFQWLFILLLVPVLASEYPHHAPGVVVLYQKEGGSAFHGDRQPRPGHFAKGKYDHGHSLPGSAKSSSALVPAASILASGFIHGRPICARDIDLCVYSHDYPIDKVQTIVDRYYNQMYDLYHTLYKTPPHEVQWVENYTLAFAHEKQHGSFVCRSETVYLRIGWAKNWKGHWMTVVNTERFPQVTRIEKCKYRNKPCDYMVPCYKSSCKQREMLYPLIAVNPYDPGQKPVIDLFPVPSGCVCYVDEFRFH